MAKAGRVLAALKRDGWIEARRSGSHRVLAKGEQQRIWAYHEGVDLGGPVMARDRPRLPATPMLNCGNCRMVVAISTLRVEFFFDEEASSWHLRVPGG